MVNYETLVKHLNTADQKPFGLLSQQASPTAGILNNRFGPRLARLFSPEHGWFGFADAGEKTGSTVHPFWNIPILSLYGETRRPTPEMLDGIGRVVIDLGDIGVRCYTYLATLKNMLEAAADAQLPVTVLDRPIPLGGILDGPMREVAFASFVAPLNIPLCHGMTPGECARYIVQEEKLDLDLTVIRMRDWAHTDRAPWTNFTPPSPGIRSWDSAALYPATVFTEAYPAVDCDRQGPLAFRVLGAPWMDLAGLLDDFVDALPACGMGVRPIRYMPSGGPYAGRALNGLLLSVENPDAFYPVTAGTILFAAIQHRHGREFLENARPEWMDKLMGGPSVRNAYADRALSGLFQTWIDEQDAFMPARISLYPR
ncbi:MAG: exo-beta-N-acetylmuramidase NamZ domain-containing protein [Kiritimatiellia bacterium]